MKKIIIFNIKNIQDEYAKCLQFMEHIKLNGDNRPDSSLSAIQIKCPIEKDIYRIACEVEQKYSIETNSQWDDMKEVLWCFRIHIEEDDDIVNLMHYYLIRQKYKNIFAILITPGIQYDMKVSEYLSFEMKKDKNNIFIKTISNEIEKYGTVHRLAGSSLKEKKDVRLTKFLPLIEVTFETYDFLSGTVESARKKIEKEQSGKRYLWEKTVMNTCAGLFTQYNPTKSEKYMRNDEYIKATSNISVLTYILFCSFRNHCIDRRNVFDILKIEQELSDARDIAEGILQILENIILHSQNKMGYFSFRIHDKKKSEYLKRTYWDYLSDERNSSNATFLEMFIADCYIPVKGSIRESILSKQFISTLRKRSSNDKTLEPFIQEYQKLEVKDFFDYAVWKKYNAVSDNIIEHYGLQLFDKIVSSCNGCFAVISTTDYIYSEEQRYCSVQNGGERSRYVVPGTQYRALLPISERSYEQEYAGMDFCDYSIRTMLQPVKEGIVAKDIYFAKKIKEINKIVSTEIQRRKDIESPQKAFKERLIQEISKEVYRCLEESVSGESQYIHHFILDGIIGAGLVEIIFKAYMKALIRFRGNIGGQTKVYTAFGKLSKEFITEFCYLMGIYYYKAEESVIMKNTEMYFWGVEYYEDLLISGENLHIVHYAVMERAILRGIYPRWLNFIDYVWKKYDSGGRYDEIDVPLSTLPYDVIVKDGNKTIFENIVEIVLNKPMADRELGCLIDNTHIQLSSKVHVSRFYNGHVLFLNNYFTNYFSYFIVDKIRKYIDEEEKKVQNIVLVGYESYSEMLLVETSELLNSYIEEKALKSSYKILPYIISESTDKKLILRSAEGCFDKNNTLNWESYKDSKFVFIVPISSTLSIFEKIQVGLEKNLGIIINDKNIMANYALILSRDIYQEKYEEDDRSVSIDCYMTEVERDYWKEKTGHRIVTKDRGVCVDYFIEVCGGWSKASQCKCCFPENSICEKPLIKTDITGLAPLTQLGQKRKWKEENSISKENMKRIMSLSDVLTYNHIERGGNHYLYYFDTVIFFYNNRKQIDEWLQGISMEVGKNRRCYSFIVSPLHATNAGFTEEVNKVLFHNTAHIIRLDFCKTYRSNFMQQFSYLQILYQNIEKSSLRDGWKTEINFYFVDDEVVSGKTLIRAKSLIEGLFERFEQVDYIKINSFKKIFVLINRLSDASKHNYIENIENYESFVNFNVSTIQNHDDFCFMCKLVDRAKSYKYMSSTNEMDAEWGKIETKFKVKNYTWAEQNKEYKQDKYKSRMLAAHYSEAAMWDLSEDATPEEYFRIMIIKLFYGRLYKRKGKIALSENNQEVFISLIKTLSRPFFVYRNNAKEAALHLLIVFFESFLGTDYQELLEWVNGIIEIKDLKIGKEMEALWEFLHVWGRRMDDSAYNLLLDLLEQLADMESGYIIRRENIIKVFQFYHLIADKKFGVDSVLRTENSQEKLLEKKSAERKFELSYALFIKQITNEDADETKSLWVENLFYFGKELNSKDSEKERFFNNFCGYQTAFGRNILVENTKIIYDGIKSLAESVSDEKWEGYEKWILEKNSILEDTEKEIMQDISRAGKEISDTQLESFKHILEYYGLELDSEKVCLEALLYGLMFNINTEGIPFELFYQKFYFFIKEITKAEVQLLMISSRNDQAEDLLYHDASCIIYDSRTELNLSREIKLKDKPLVDNAYLRNIPYELDTYFINKERAQAIIKYSISLKHRFEKDSIYLILQYPESQEIRQLLFDIRLILLCRSRTITRMKRDFNNSLFQSLWQTKMHNMLLEHFKNASHEDPEKGDAAHRIINYIWQIDKECRNTDKKENEEKGLRRYKAVLLKMLADNNVSSIYHEILAKRLVTTYVCTTDFSAKGIFADIKDIRYVLSKSKEGGECQNQLNEENELPLISIDENVLNGSIYYIAPDPFRSHLLVISLIQNAYRHGNNKKPVHIYREPGMLIGSDHVDYLCIANGIDLRQIDIIKHRIGEHIDKPVASRKTHGDYDKCEGITLFSLNRYCQKIIDGLLEEEQEERNNLVEYEFNGDEIVFRVPILKGEH